MLILDGRFDESIKAIIQVKLFNKKKKMILLKNMKCLLSELPIKRKPS